MPKRQDIRQLGRTGENLAAKFLQKKGFRILERNFHAHGGEIDIVAVEGNFLVFVEVKTAYGAEAAPPVFRVTPQKQRRLGKAAQAYCVTRDVHEHDIRFDVVTVQFVHGKPVIEHIENAFWLEPDW